MEKDNKIDHPQNSLIDQAKQFDDEANDLRLQLTAKQSALTSLKKLVSRGLASESLIAGQEAEIIEIETKLASTEQNAMTAHKAITENISTEE